MKNIHVFLLLLPLLAIIGCDSCTHIRTHLADKYEDYGYTSLKKNHTFNLSEAYPTGITEMNEVSRKKLTSETQQFINKYIYESQKNSWIGPIKITINGSSDERPFRHSGGNLGLTDGRTRNGESIMRNIFENFKYHDSIPVEIVNYLKNPLIERKSPAGKWGRGFKPILAMTNPVTGKFFTDTEVASLNTQEKEYCWGQARFIRVNIEILDKSNRKKQYQDIIEKMANYDNVILLIDESTSMSGDLQKFSKSIDASIKLELDKNHEFSKTKIHVIGFCNTLNKSNEIEVAPHQLAAALSKRKLANNGNERMLNSVKEAIKNNRTIGRTLLIAISDEPIQDYSQEIINEWSKENQFDIMVGILSYHDRIISWMDLDVIHENLEKAISNFKKKFPKIKDKSNEKILERFSGVGIDKFGREMYVFYTRDISGDKYTTILP